MAAIEDLHPMVAFINHVQVIAGINGNMIGGVEMGIVRPRFACHPDSRAVETSTIEHLDTMVVEIADVDVPSTIEGNTNRPIEVSVVRTPFPVDPQLRQIIAGWIELDNAI